MRSKHKLWWMAMTTMKEKREEGRKGEKERKRERKGGRGKGRKEEEIKESHCLRWTLLHFLYQ